MVFLGGTCNGSLWREQLIPMLDGLYFNPVSNWTESDYQTELTMRETCEFCLYVITPLMTGVYSIAEVVDDSNKRPDKAILCVLHTDTKDGEELSFSPAQTKSLAAVERMVAKNGATVFNTLADVAAYLNAMQ